MKYDYDFDLFIVGAGPAGLAAAIYACRANLKVGFADKDAPGGKVVTTSFVENYPGFQYIEGPALSLKFLEHAQSLGSKFIFSEVKDILTNIDDYKYVLFENSKVVRAKTVMIATGMMNRKIGADNELRLYSRGISYCAICDGALYRNKPVAVIGSGLSAIEEAIYLSEICSHVTVISNKKQFNTQHKSIDTLKNKKNVKILFEKATLSFNGKEKLESITLEDLNNHKRNNLNVDAAFIFIGFLPVAPLVNGQSILDPLDKFIKVNHDCETNIPGLYAGGDIIIKKIRQIATAVNDGVIVALSAAEYISNRKWE